LDREEKKRILKSYLPLREELRKIEEEIIFWRSKLTRFGGSVVKFSNTKGTRINKADEAFEKLEMLDYRFSAKIISLSDLRSRIEDAIEELDDPIHRLLMRMRYVEGHTWELIAVELSYSWQHVHKIHADALNLINMR